MTFWDQLNNFFGANQGAWMLALLVLALSGWVFGLIALLRLSALMKPLKKLKADGTWEKMVPAMMQEMESNRASLQATAAGLHQMQSESLSFFKHTGFVRYDAFEDVGGQQSYSLCLLDSLRNGYIITYLTGRNSTRSYAVQIQEGQASRKLSDEETRALSEAQVASSL
jgi:hypothetical protein